MRTRPRGESRVRYAELFDAEARLHELRLHAAANIGAAEHVLDIGCGTGRSTRAAGRAAAAGTVLGVDISVPVLELARRDFDAEITRLAILAAAIDTAIQQWQDTRGEWRR